MIVTKEEELRHRVYLSALHEMGGAPTELFFQRPPEQLKSGQILFWSGDAGSDIFHLVKGTIRFCSLLMDGRRMISGFAVAGEVFSLSDRGRYVHTAEAASNCYFHRIHRNPATGELKDEPQPRSRIQDHLQREPWTMQSEMMKLLHKSAEESIAYFIFSLGRRQNPELSDGSRIRIEMSRIDIADYLGLTVETVCRGIKRLTREAILSGLGPHEFITMDAKALRKRAGGEHPD